MSHFRKMISSRNPAATATARPSAFRNESRNRLARTLGRRALNQTNRTTTTAASAHPANVPLSPEAKPAYFRKPLGLCAKLIATHVPSVAAMPARIQALRRSGFRRAPVVIGQRVSKSFRHLFVVLARFPRTVTLDLAQDRSGAIAQAIRRHTSDKLAQ